MIEAHITIDRDLKIKAYKRAYGITALGNGASFYGWRAFVVFLAVAVADGFYESGDLIGVHLCIITALAIAASFHTYFDWVKKLAAGAQDTELHVVLDDEGVTIKNEHDKRIEWSSYAYFKEYEDYLEITHSSGEISFVPKRNELADVIIFTRSKISSKPI
ncbi:MAG TPA: YcxB family protein [Pyrinomonadaceae bacterium]|nr:YcxB family protein [Pyrinomonadaceae bacterium]